LLNINKNPINHKTVELPLSLYLFYVREGGRRDKGQGPRDKGQGTSKKAKKNA